MKQCPECRRWTMEFDDYFRRYRCYNGSCQWMQSSSAERAIKRIGVYDDAQQMKQIFERAIGEIGVTLTGSYDPLNDTLIFSFGPDEVTFDLPESDGRLVWKIGHDSGQVVGFDVLGAKKLGVYKVDINILARKSNIEKEMSRSNLIDAGKPTSALIRRIDVAVSADEDEEFTGSDPLSNVVRDAIGAWQHAQMMA
jgi:hypothetical protein